MYFFFLYPLPCRYHFLCAIQVFWCWSWWYVNDLSFMPHFVLPPPSLSSLCYDEQNFIVSKCRPLIGGLWTLKKKKYLKSAVSVFSLSSFLPSSNPIFHLPHSFLFFPSSILLSVYYSVWIVSFTHCASSTSPTKCHCYQEDQVDPDPTRPF
jgi:hypothetical protein